MISSGALQVRTLRYTIQTPTSARIHHTPCTYIDTALVNLASDQDGRRDEANNVNFQSLPKVRYEAEGEAGKHTIRASCRASANARHRSQTYTEIGSGSSLMVVNIALKVC